MQLLYLNVLIASIRSFLQAGTSHLFLGAILLLCSCTRPVHYFMFLRPSTVIPALFLVYFSSETLHTSFWTQCYSLVSFPVPFCGPFWPKLGRRFCPTNGDYCRDSGVFGAPKLIYFSTKTSSHYPNIVFLFSFISPALFWFKISRFTLTSHSATSLFSRWFSALQFRCVSSIRVVFVSTFWL